MFSVVRSRVRALSETFESKAAAQPTNGQQRDEDASEAAAPRDADHRRDEEKESHKKENNEKTKA